MKILKTAFGKIIQNSKGKKLDVVMHVKHYCKGQKQYPLFFVSLRGFSVLDSLEFNSLSNNNNNDNLKKILHRNV